MLTARAAALDVVWPRLACSPSPYRVKVNVLQTAAWTKALYGSSAAQLSKVHFQHLRTGPLRGLNARKPATNPMLHLSLVEFPVADPAFFALRISFRDLIRHGSGECFASVADEILHEAGLVWASAAGMFRDFRGFFCPFSASPQELDKRLVDAW